MTMQGGFSILKWTALQCANGNPEKQRAVECSRLAQNRIQPGENDSAVSIGRLSPLGQPGFAIE
ncbi:MAG: hypothetical protein JNJ93_03600 [Acinetobacter sp.]|nr:hypothetical protein [Acinetobacter sp.]